MREERLEHAEALGRDRADGPVAGGAGAIGRAARVRAPGGSPVCRSRSVRERRCDRVAQLVRLERDGTTVLAQDPAGERLDPRVRGLEDAVVELARVGERAVHPPGGVALDSDPRPAAFVADLPRPRDAVRLDVEVGRQPEVALAAGREADVASGSARRGRS